MVYKTVGDRILPASLAFPSLCHLSPALCSIITKTLTAFLSPNALLCLSAFGHTALSSWTYLQSPPPPTPRVSHLIDEHLFSFQHSAHVSSPTAIIIIILLIIILTPHTPRVPLMKRIVSLALRILSLASTFIGIQY